MDWKLANIETRSTWSNNNELVVASIGMTAANAMEGMEYARAIRLNSVVDELGDELRRPCLHFLTAVCKEVSPDQARCE